MLPLGQPLERRVAMLNAKQRGKQCRKLHNNVVRALQAAHALDLCHRDLRPHNVIYDRATRNYVVIDWGLAAADGAPSHLHLGGKAFFDDAIVRAQNFDSTVPYYAQYDFSSAVFIAYAFMSSTKLRVSWEGGNRDMINNRNLELGTFVEDFLA